MTNYQEIMQLISAETGLNIDSIGLQSIVHGISQSMKKLGITDSRIYTELLQQQNNLLSDLIEEIKVPETWFFRDEECFNYLNTEIVNNFSNYSPSNPLRILSAPTSTGEEAYSVVMLAFDCGLSADSIQVVGCDISENSLKIAKKKLYRKVSFRNSFYGFQDKYFTFVDGQFKISDRVAEVPVFAKDNLVKNEFLSNESKFDYIFCKNLLIYLNDEARNKVLSNIIKLLKDDGSLLVGLSEINYFTRNGFEQIKHNMAFACKKSIQQNEDCSKSANITTPSKSTLRVSRHNQKIKPAREIRTHLKNEINSISQPSTIDRVKKMADTGDFVGAERICTMILQDDYSNSEALYYMGLIQNALQKFGNALDYFNKVIYLNPNHYESLVHISLLYEAVGDFDRATLYKSRAERSYVKNNLSDGS